MMFFSQPQAVQIYTFNLSEIKRVIIIRRIVSAKAFLFISSSSTDVQKLDVPSTSTLSERNFTNPI